MSWSDNLFAGFTSSINCDLPIGNDINTIDAASVTVCVDACRVDLSCSSWVFKNQKCFLKSAYTSKVQAILSKGAICGLRSMQQSYTSANDDILY